MKVKICGITNYEDAKFCVESGADALGFIFYHKSKRYILPEKAKEIVSKLPAFVFKIGVFVNESLNAVNEIAEKVGLNIVQLHGDESSDYIELIKYPVIKSFRISPDFNFGSIEKYKNCNFLLDAYDENYFGGSGKVFNWDIIPQFLRSKIILAGGISEKNIQSIFENINPYAVDIASSLEKSPGIKDHKKIKSFFELYNSLRNSKC
jgi:phosphoribosylanthranilate isomerase